ncbi:hypothetical protein [Aeromicrobium sp. CTD01-1L150]|uniref:hypothetical protein n=1 Tax=Aeromicrobium sp. CTD01-1L150 TaxID=3341830 RepID=UPI0035C1A33B
MSAALVPASGVMTPVPDYLEQVLQEGLRRLRLDGHPIRLVDPEAVLGEEPNVDGSEVCAG